MEWDGNDEEERASLYAHSTSSAWFNNLVFGLFLNIKKVMKSCMMVLNIDVLLRIDHIAALNRVFLLGHGGHLFKRKKILKNK
jgi:hypothetical protein